MTNISDLKEQSDNIADFDTRLREIKEEMDKLQFEQKFVQDKRDSAVWKLQDSIDTLSES